MLYGGFKGASPGEYITYRSSDPGDFVVSLTGFAMYMHVLKEKYANTDNQDFDHKALKCRFYGYFWLFFTIYSCYWGVAYWISLRERNLAVVDYAVSAYFAVCILLYIYVGKSLTNQIQSNYDSIEGSGKK